MKLCNCYLDFENNENGIFSNKIDIFEEKCFFEPHVKRILYSSKDRFNNFMSTISNDGVLKIWNIEKFKKDENFKNNIENEDGIK